MRSDRLSRLCVLQVYALLLAVPFEYYFCGREETLFTSLKLQVLLLFVTWIGAKLTASRDSGSATRTSLPQALPGKLLAAMAAFALIQLISAAAAPEFRGNAATAAVKMCLGVVLGLVAADLTPGLKERSGNSGLSVPDALMALSFAGTCMALLGLGELAGIHFFERAVKAFRPSRYFLGDHLRLASTMEYPNTAGSFLSASLCATLALATVPSSRIGRSAWRPALPAMIVIQGVALALTYSRGAVCSTVIAIAVATVAARSLMRRGAAVAATAASIAVLLGGAAYSWRARDETNPQQPSPPGRVAHYGPGVGRETRVLVPDSVYHEAITVRNDSGSLWPRGECGIAFRWHSISGGWDSPLRLGAGFPADIAPRQETVVPVSLSTPSQEGEYLLIWFVFRRGPDVRAIRDSYSPAVVCVVGSPRRDGATALSAKARRYLKDIGREQRRLDGVEVPRRRELWSAALRMFRSRPLLGVGPDNFRMLKWRFMDDPGGDSTILANNLYLEVLSGSGVLGLASFLWVIWEFVRRVGSGFGSAASVSDRGASYFGVAYLSGFLVHGAVDYFLKFTPVFLLFWLVIGSLCAVRRDPC